MLPSFWSLPDRELACASDIQMQQRHHWLGKIITWATNAGHIATLIAIFMAFNRLRKNKSVFTKSTTVIIASNLAAGILHAISYALIQNTAFYRGHWAHDWPCSIMFQEYECFPYYGFNIFCRLLILAMNTSQSVDTHCTLENKMSKPSYKRGVIFTVLSIIVSACLAVFIARDGPNDNILPNCLQRQGRQETELIFQLCYYLVPGVFNIGLTGWSWFGSYQRNNTKPDSVHQKFENQTIHKASRFIFWTNLVVMLLMLLYPISVIILIWFRSSIDPVLLGVLVPLFYTYPWATLIYAVLVAWFIEQTMTEREKQRKALIAKKSAEAVQAKYFDDLKNDWEVGFEAKGQPAQNGPNGPRRHHRVSAAGMTAVQVN